LDMVAAACVRSCSCLADAREPLVDRGPPPRRCSSSSAGRAYGCARPWSGLVVVREHRPAVLVDTVLIASFCPLRGLAASCPKPMRCQGQAARRGVRRARSHGGRCTWLLVPTRIGSVVRDEDTAPLGAPGVVAGLSAPTTAVEQAGAQGHRRECHQRRSRPETRLTPPPSPHRKARQPAGERRHRTHGRPEHEHVAVPQMTTCAVLRTLLTAVPDAEPSKPSDARADA
jgi:hypothetical protein